MTRRDVLMAVLGAVGANIKLDGREPVVVDLRVVGPLTVRLDGDSITLSPAQILAALRPCVHEPMSDSYEAPDGTRVSAEYWIGVSKTSAGLRRGLRVCRICREVYYAEER